MLGPAKERQLDRPILASLEALIPANNFYRRLDAKLDLSFVRDWVADRYAEGGRPSIDPVVFFKLQLILFFEGLRSERKLIETASLHLAHHWYLGYTLDEPLPDHSSLTRIRQRLGLALFERFFEHVVELCQEAGLVWGKEVFIDATKVRANADVDSVTERDDTPFGQYWGLQAIERAIGQSGSSVVSAESLRKLQRYYGTLKPGLDRHYELTRTLSGLTSEVHG